MLTLCLFCQFAWYSRINIKAEGYGPDVPVPLCTELEESMSCANGPAVCWQSIKFDYKETWDIRIMCSVWVVDKEIKIKARRRIWL